MAELTWENITYNLEDALEELQRLYGSISPNDQPDEIEFRIAMQHIYHHLNFAWNTRHIPIAEMTKEQFDEWGKFPTDLMWE